MFAKIEQILEDEDQVGAFCRKPIVTTGILVYLLLGIGIISRSGMSEAIQGLIYITFLTLPLILWSLMSLLGLYQAQAIRRLIAYIFTLIAISIFLTYSGWAA